MKLQSYFFAFAIVVCMLKSTVAVGRQQAHVYFDDLYPQTPFSLSLRCCMRILGELESCNMCYSPQVCKCITELMTQLKQHIVQVDPTKIVSEDAHYLKRLMCHIEHSYKKFILLQHTSLKEYASLYASLNILTPVQQRPNQYQP